MFINDLSVRIRELERNLANEQSRYISSIKSNENGTTIKNIRYDILTRKFELQESYSQLK
jgi:hypothetical protein